VTFTVAIRPPVNGAYTAVAVSGDVDITNAAAFRVAIAELDGPRPLIVDLSPLRYLDSAGFAALDQLLTQPGIAVVLDPASPVRAAADIMGVPCHDTLDAAVAAS